MLKAVGMVVPKIKETRLYIRYIVRSSEFTLPQKWIMIHVCRQGIIACNNNNMRNPSLRRVTHVVIVACAIIPCLSLFLALPSLHPSTF